MLDRVREALFSTLGPWFAVPDEARVLDLFAGTGSLGLEALSRGAKSVQFVEKEERVLQVLRENVAELEQTERVEIVRASALERAAWGEPGSADVVFLDPPYPFLKDVETKLEVLSALHMIVREILAEEGVVVLHTPRGRLDAEELEDDLVARERIYGSNSLWYVQREDEE